MNGQDLDQGGTLTLIYPVLCSWCHAEGKVTITRFSPIPNSSGMCPTCQAKFIIQADNMELEGGRR